MATTKETPMSTECPLPARLKMIRDESDRSIRKALRDLDRQVEMAHAHAGTLMAKLTLPTNLKTRSWYQHESDRRGL